MDNILDLLIKGRYEEAFKYPPEELSLYLSVNQKWLDEYLKFHYQLDFKFELLIEDIVYFRSAPLTKYLIKRWLYSQRDQYQAELLMAAAIRLKDKLLQQLITSTSNFTIDDVRITDNKYLQSAIIDENRIDLVGWDKTHEGDYTIKSLAMLDLIINSPYEISYSVARSSDAIFSSFTRRVIRGTNRLAAGAGTMDMNRIIKVIHYMGSPDLQSSLNEAVKVDNQECINYLTNKYSLSIDNVPEYYKIVSTNPNYMKNPNSDMVYLLHEMNPINIYRVFNTLNDKIQGIKYLRPRNFLPYLLKV